MDTRDPVGHDKSDVASLKIGVWVAYKLLGVWGSPEYFPWDRGMHVHLKDAAVLTVEEEALSGTEAGKTS
jgi:hypothetical protein